MSKVNKKIEELLDELDADDLEYCGEWKGYKTYFVVYDFEPIDGKYPCIGLPEYILVKGREVRLSEPEEGEAIHRYFYIKQAESADAKTLKNELTEEI